MYRPISQPINQSINLPINQLDNHAINYPHDLRFGRQRMLFVTIVLRIIAGYALALVYNYWAFAFVRFCQGVFQIGSYILAFVLGKAMSFCNYLTAHIGKSVSQVVDISALIVWKIILFMQ